MAALLPVHFLPHSLVDPWVVLLLHPKIGEMLISLAALEKGRPLR